MTHTIFYEDGTRMKRVGRRLEPPQIAAKPSGQLLAAGARLSESIARLAPVGIMPKGVYRYKSHEQANRHEQNCLARAMARLVVERQHG